MRQIILLPLVYAQEIVGKLSRLQSLLRSTAKKITLLLKLICLSIVPYCLFLTNLSVVDIYCLGPLSSYFILFANYNRLKSKHSSSNQYRNESYPNSQNLQFDTVWIKRIFMDAIKLEILRGGDYPVLSDWDINKLMGICTRQRTVKGYQRVDV